MLSAEPSQRCENGLRSIWEDRAKLYDLCEGSDLRRGAHKKILFRRIEGKTLFLAIGTGLDIRHLPIGPGIIAMDISTAMLEKSRQRAGALAGNLSLVQGDAATLCFPDGCFDTVVTACTMCSVPHPTTVLSELHRVLRPGGRLLMFEHVRSRNWLLGAVLDLMTIVTRRRGTEMNRDTLTAATKAGFSILEVEPVFLDIILAVEALKGARSGPRSAGTNEEAIPRTAEDQSSLCLRTRLAAKG